MRSMLYAMIICMLVAGAGQGAPRAETAAPAQSPAAPVELPVVTEMVGDLDPQAFSESFSANWLLQPAGDEVYFVGSDQTHGGELWRSDGTLEGTTLVADVWPGPDSSWPNDFTASGENLYFAADDGAHGSELWASGLSGTALMGDSEPGVRKFAPKIGSLQPQQLTPFGEGDLLFTSNQDSQLWRAIPGEAPVLLHSARPNEWIKILATDPAGSRFFFGIHNYDNGIEAPLWVRAGTPAGARLIHTFAPVPGHYYAFYEGVMLNSSLVFKFYNSAGGGTEVWASDGSETGTKVVYSSTMNYYITLTPIYSLGRVFFTAGTYGAELWVTDGSTAGTYPVASDLSAIKNLTDVNGRAVFTTDVLWSSDATPEGTQVIDTFQGSPEIGMEVVNGRAIFASIDSAYVGDTIVFTSTLWATDATPGGIRTLYTVEPTYGEGISIFRSPASDGSHIYYFNEGVDGHDELWQTDGTVSGTVMIEQIDNLVILAWVGSRLFFTSSNVPIEPLEYPTSNLGISDGKPAGTGLVIPGQEPQGSSSPSQFTLAGGPSRERVFFTAEDAAHGRELWAANPDGSGALLVKDINPGTASSNPLEPTVLGDTLFFTAELAGGRALWKSDGTLEGTVQLGEFNYPYELTVFDGQIYFLSFSHLWKTSGGAPEIVYTPGEWMSLAEAEVAGNQLFLAQWDGDGHPMRLLVSDGTSAGTTSVRDFGIVSCGKGGCSNTTLSQLTGADDRLYFAATPDSGRETDVWTSDGTLDGTLQLSGLNDTEFSSDPSLLTPHGTALYFAEDDGSAGLELWKSDGTPQGTVLVSDIFPESSRSGPASSGPTDLTWVGDALYFAATDPAGGRELWRYQVGINPPVQRVADVTLGDGRTNPSQMAAVSDVLLYAACDSEAGNELWVSGGSAITTRRLADLRPGPDSSNPRGFVVSGEWALFQANDGIHGAELWRLPLTALSRAPQAEIGAQGGVLASYLDGVSYTFGAGTFGGMVTVSHTVEASPPALPGEGWVVEVFEVSGTQAPAQLYTLTVEYMLHQTRPAIESSLKLLRWDGSAWEEVSSTLDKVTGTITAHPSKWGLFAVVGETREVYLPVTY